MLLRIVSCFLLAWLCCGSQFTEVCAQQVTRRLGGVAEIRENTWYYLCGYYPKRDTYAMMRRNMKKDKLCSTQVSNPGPECQIDASWHAFRLKEMQDGYIICSDTAFLAVKNTNDLQWVKKESAATVWEITEQGTEGAFVFANTADDKFYLVLTNLSMPQNGTYVEGYYFGYYKYSDNPIYLYETDTAPRSELSDDGRTLTLMGDWTAEGICNIDWQTAQVLDISLLKLPENLENFRHRPANVHTVVVVAAAQQQYIPSEWEWVLLKDKDACHLFRTAELNDRQGFGNVISFECDTLQIAYRRTLVGDGQYETLCLPFSWDVPETLQAYRAIRVTADSVVFESLDSVAAGQAVLIQPVFDELREAVIYAAGGTVYDAALSKNAFTGTLRMRDVISDDAAFFLNRDGTHFVPAPTGSRLPPFRAYIARDVSNQ